MGSIFTTIFYQPILNLLVFLYNITPGHDIGVVIVLLTLIIKIILYPLSQTSLKSQKSLQELQPKIEELKRKYGQDKEKLGRETLALYRENKVNPFSSCLPLLIQLPFLYAVFRVFRNGFKPESLALVYSFIARPEIINPVTMGFFDLSKASPVLAVLSGLAQFWQAKMMATKKPAVNAPGAKDENMMAMMNKQMLYMMPALTVFIGFSLPGGLVFYWFLTTLLTVAQQYYMFRKKEKELDKTTKQQ
jgi:YidC/Oxa1 family membrane protein insertase